MGTPDVRIETGLNKYVWSHGVRLVDFHFLMYKLISCIKLNIF